MITEYKPFFSLFNSPKEKVLKVLRSLTFEERKLLYKKYHRDLKNTEIIYNLTEEENKEINERIIRKIRLRLKRIEENMCLISIYDVFPNETLSDIKQAMIQIKLLNYFQKLFGSKLTGLCYTYKDDSKSNISKENVYRIKQRLAKNKGIHRVRIIRPFVSLFLKYKKLDETYEDFEDRLKIYVNNMSNKYKEVIYSLYNEDLNNVILKHPSFKEDRKIFSEAYSVIIAKLQRDLDTERNRNVRKYEHILTLFDNGTTLEEIRQKLRLNENIYMLSKKKYGEDLNTPSDYGTLSRKENQKLYDFYNKVNGMIFREKRMSAFIMAKNMFDSPVHKAFSEIYGSSLAYALVLYLNFSEYLSLNEICDLSNNDMEDLLKVINNYEELGDDVDYKKNIRRYFKRL